MRLTIRVVVLVLALLVMAAPAAAQWSDPTGAWDVDLAELEIFTSPELRSGTAVFDVRFSSSRTAWEFVDRATGQPTCIAVRTETRSSPSSAHAECGSFVGSITWYEIAGPDGLETNWFFMELSGMGHSDQRLWMVGRRQRAMSVSITAPAAGATVSGSTTVSAQASNLGSFSNTWTLAVDGTPVSSQTVSGMSASFTWNTTTVGNGTHTLTVTVSGEAGAASDSRQVTVSNTTTSALKLFITQPKSGATVSGTSWVVLWLEGTTSTSNTYTLTVDGLTVAQVTTSSRGPVSIPWDTKLVGNGTRTLRATARDRDGKTGTASVSIIVRN